MALNEYTYTDPNGREVTVQLSDEDAKLQGLTKSKAPANKQATPANKAAAPAKKAASPKQAEGDK